MKQNTYLAIEAAGHGHIDNIPSQVKVSAAKVLMTK